MVFRGSTNSTKLLDDPIKTHILYLSHTTIKIDKITTTVKAASYSNEPIALFNLYGKSSGPSVRIMYSLIKENDIIIQNLIPAIDSNGNPCMYDTVSQQTFYNQGTGEFITGPVVKDYGKVKSISMNN